MSRCHPIVFLILLVVSPNIGCVTMLESDSIEAFTQALDESDYTGLYHASSKTFRQKALRNADACFKDLKILNIPDGEIAVLKIDDVSPLQKKVTVEVGEKKRKLRYELVRDSEEAPWVVDDILMAQKRNGVTATRSVTEQMDLLLSVREFIATWNSGERNEVLSSTTRDLSATLANLPPVYLAHLTQSVAEAHAKQSNMKPSAQLDDDTAVVRLPRSGGETVVMLKRIDHQWRVSEVSIENKDADKSVSSIARKAEAISATIAFLDAYRSENKPRLKLAATRKFYSRSLAPGDLRTVKLPSADVPPNDYKVKLLGERAEFLLPTPTDLYKFSLVREEKPNAVRPEKPFRVEEVTVYQLDGDQEMRLSALFTVHATAEIFADAMTSNDLTVLRHTSTGDLTHRVWHLLDDEDVKMLPLVRVPEPKVETVDFRGALAEITMKHGKMEHRIILRGRNGEFRVDDVLTQSPGLPDSLKTRLQVLIPIMQYARALKENDVQQLQRFSSADFNRSVWRQLDKVPHLAEEAGQFLASPLRKIELQQDHAIATLGDDRRGAQIRLALDQHRFAVDEIVVVKGPEATQRTPLKQTLRLQMAQLTAPVHKSVGP